MCNLKIKIKNKQNRNRPIDRGREQADGCQREGGLRWRKFKVSIPLQVMGFCKPDGISVDFCVIKNRIWKS